MNPALQPKANVLQEPEIKFATRPSVPFDQLKFKSSFSLNEPTHIKSGNGKAAPAQNDVETARLPDRNVSAEEVSASVLKYAETKQNEGSRQIATILKTAGIRYADTVITLTINNETQKEQFLLVKQQFIDNMRLDLQNGALTVEIEISEEEIQTRAYKPNDIFKAMTEKNPALLEMKKRFDLEIDY